MKKLGLLVMPIMTISLLASCGGSKTESIIEHFVTFESYGGSHVPTQRVKDGDTATPPRNPTRKNDDFLGWFIDFDQPAYTFNEKVSEDITLYAGWKVKPDPGTTCHFKFTGTNCSINGFKDEPFEIDLPKCIETQFQINPDDGYQSPTLNNFRIIKGTGDIDYHPDSGLIDLTMYDDVEIEAKSEPIEYCTVTLNAGEGTFVTGLEYKFDVKKGDNLSKNIRLIPSPYLNKKTFAYYTYSDETAIDYDDPVTSDVELTANYLDASKTPYSDLDSSATTWDRIKAVAVTNGNPHFCFKIGATKTVKINNLDHEVRIIGFNQDKNPNGNSLGITFEFGNVITDSNGNAITKEWNEGDYSSTNYDYRKSTLNDFLNIDVLDMLPSSGDIKNPDLIEVIKQVDKKVGVSTDGGASYIATSFDGETHPYPYLFPLAHDEIHDCEETPTYVTYGETDGIYEYYKDHGGDIDEDKAYRIKKAVSGKTGEPYWLRSPCVKYRFLSIALNDDGSMKYENYRIESDKLAISPAFCV